MAGSVQSFLVGCAGLAALFAAAETCFDDRQVHLLVEKVHKRHRREDFKESGGLVLLAEFLDWAVNPVYQA